MQRKCDMLNVCTNTGIQWHKELMLLQNISMLNVLTFMDLMAPPSSFLCII